MVPSLAAYIDGVLPDLVAALSRRGWFSPEDVRDALNRESDLALSPADDGRIGAVLGARDDVRMVTRDGTRWGAAGRPCS